MDYINEKDLLDQGYIKQCLSVHLVDYGDKIGSNNVRRMSYDLGRDFSQEQIAVLQSWVNEVNNRFMNIKICLSGTGYEKASIPEEDNNPENN